MRFVKCLFNLEGENIYDTDKIPQSRFLYQGARLTLIKRTVVLHRKNNKYFSYRNELGIIYRIRETVKDLLQGRKFTLIRF